MQYGYTTKASGVGEIKLLRTTDITKSVLDWDKVPYCSILPKDPEKYILEEGDIVISRTGSLGFSTRIVNIPSDTVFASYLIRFKPSELISGKYLEYFFKSSNYWNQIRSISSGVAVNNINAKKLGDIKIPLMPLNEQKRIVEKLDELINIIESIKINLKNADYMVKQFRQSILSYLLTNQNINEEKEINVWQQFELGVLIEELHQGWSPKCENFPAEINEWGVIKTSSVQKINFIEKENKKLPINLKVKKQLTLRNGDVLITRAGPRVRCGVTCYIEKDFPNLIICDKVYRIRVNKKKVLPKFLVYLLNSPVYLSKIDDMKTGISESGLNITQKKFNSMIINLPDIGKQNEILIQLDHYFAISENLLMKIENTKKQTDKLIKSVIDKAYKGKLLSQNSLDDSAEELLTEIQKLKMVSPIKKNIEFNSLNKIKKFDNKDILTLIVNEYLNKEITIEDLYIITKTNKDKLSDLIFQLLKKQNFSIGDKNYSINNFWKNNTQVLKIEER